jgi:hypothetical protein
VKHEKNQKQLRDAQLDTVMDQLGVCSANECTGMIPEAIMDESEQESYEDIYPYILPEDEPFDE